ncbi:terpenoid synthase [Irpex rosettiformis]|uniref:Terpenoid synthase n=1 Tax=Irpex rosettiformis TaxID=378272 RepID=A0ACB8UAN0_9APHY|nr:terpenoid synthase [Irpex rosettiformis]
MSSPSRIYQLPDLHSICHWKASFNAYYIEARQASSAWVLSYKVFTGKKLEFFKQGGSELLCAWAYPYTGLEQLRIACDFVNLLFTIDEISDEQSGKDAINTGLIFLNAMKDETYDDGSVLCKMTKDFRARFFPAAGPATLGRFMQHTEAYVNGFSVEAELREKDVVLDLVAYDKLRRENSAVRYCFELFGCMLNLDLPDEIFEHPVFMRMHLAAVDMVTWSNDVYSYNMEQAMGHLTNNVLTVLQRERNFTLQEAADHVGVHFKELSEVFEAGKKELPSFGGELDKVVAQYIMAMECWVVGNLEWSFGTQRYFGADHKKIRETLMVELSPAKVFSPKNGSEC